MQTPTGVGVNGEPDDFAARYDRYVVGGGTGWVIATIAVLLALLVVAAATRAGLGILIAQLGG